MHRPGCDRGALAADPRTGDGSGAEKADVGASAYHRSGAGICDYSRHFSLWCNDRDGASLGDRSSRGSSVLFSHFYTCNLWCGFVNRKRRALAFSRAPASAAHRFRERYVGRLLGALDARFYREKRAAPSLYGVSVGTRGACLSKFGHLICSSAALAALGIWVACSGCRSGPGGAAEYVDRVQISGNDLVSESEIASGLSNHPPRNWPFFRYARFDPLGLEIDKRRIESFYQTQGFFEARVRRVKVLRLGQRRVALEFFVEEGPASLLSGVDIQGLPGFVQSSTASIVEDAGLEIGRRFEFVAYERCKNGFLSALGNAGYPHAEVRGRILADRDRHQTQVEIVLQPGPRARFGQTTVDGHEEIPETSIRNRIAWDGGDVFDPGKLAITRGRLLTSGLVGSVRFEWDKEKKSEFLDVTAHVTEPSRNEIRLGGGIGIQQVSYQLRLRGGYVRRRFLHPLNTLRLNARPAWAFFRSGGGSAGFNVDTGAEFERQDFVVPRLKFTQAIRFERIQFEGYTTQGPSIQTGLGRPFLDDRMIVGLGLRYEYSLVSADFGTEIGAPFGVVDPISVGSLEPNISYDGRDNPVDPNSGYYLRLGLELGRSFQGSTRGSYALFTPDARGYLPLGKRVVVAGRIRAGVRVDSGAPIPVTHRYFGGGAESHRGFGRRRLSPGISFLSDDPDEGAIVAPVGGEALFESSLESRFDLFTVMDNWFGLVIFLDGSDVAVRLADIDLLNLHWAAGGGVRYKTPIGAIRVDLGYRLNRKGPGDPDRTAPWALHITLGEAF